MLDDILDGGIEYGMLLMDGEQKNIQKMLVIGHVLEDIIRVEIVVWVTVVSDEINLNEITYLYEIIIHQVMEIETEYTLVSQILELVNGHVKLDIQELKMLVVID